MRTNEQRHNDEPNPEGTATRWQLSLVVLAVALVIGYLIRLPYWAKPGVYDDHVMQWMSAEVELGRLPLWDASVASIGGHIAALWIVTYWFFVTHFGTDPWVWHTQAYLVHAINTCLLFLLLQRYLSSVWGALVGAIGFSSIAIGYWDNPFQWTACGVLSWQPMLLLLAMMCVTRWNGPRSAWFAILMMLLSVIMMLTWSVSVAFLVIIPLQWFFLERRPASSTLKALVWGICWSAAFIGGFFFQVVALKTAVASSGLDTFTVSDLFQAVPVAFGILSVALANMTFWDSGTLGTDGLLLKDLLAAGLLAVSMLASRSRRLALVFSATSLFFTLGIALARRDFGVDVNLSNGRYMYLPSLMWSVVIAAVVDSLIQGVMSPKARWAPAVFSCGLVAALGAHQYHVARVASRQFDLTWGPAIADFDDQVRTLRDLAAAQRDGKAVPFPDIPILVSPVLDRAFMLSSLGVIVLEWENRRLQTEPIDCLSDAQLASARQVLAEIDTATSRDWSAMIRQFRSDMSTILWLDRWVASRNETVHVPPVSIRYGMASIPLASLARIGIEEPLLHLTFDGKAQDKGILLKSLRGDDSPESARWRQWLSAAEVSPSSLLMNPRP